ncbi:TPA: hypothetical protein ACGWER_001738 [Streptococcus agalactiae]|nr:hypothetical protein [Streptococcus agalactiae]HEO2267386.1 hypothetical protein [Streptococcus agalactiae]HEO7770312.1 hypothetical protein [Streptococcus agalactiae]
MAKTNNTISKADYSAMMLSLPEDERGSGREYRHFYVDENDEKTFNSEKEVDDFIASEVNNFLN